MDFLFLYPSPQDGDIHYSPLAAVSLFLLHVVYFIMLFMNSSSIVLIKGFNEPMSADLASEAYPVPLT